MISFMDTTLVVDIIRLQSQFKTVGSSQVLVGTTTCSATPLSPLTCCRGEEHGKLIVLTSSLRRADHLKRSDNSTNTRSHSRLRNSRAHPDLQISLMGAALQGRTPFQELHQHRYMLVADYTTPDASRRAIRPALDAEPKSRRWHDPATLGPGQL